MRANADDLGWRGGLLTEHLGAALAVVAAVVAQGGAEPGKHRRELLATEAGQRAVLLEAKDGRLH